MSRQTWTLGRLAADLRAPGDDARSLDILDAAWLLDPEDEAIRAIETVAMACHCDMGTHLTAVHARVAVRLYAELFLATTTTGSGATSTRCS